MLKTFCQALSGESRVLKTTRPCKSCRWVCEKLRKLERKTFTQEILKKKGSNNSNDKEEIKLFIVI